MLSQESSGHPWGHDNKRKQNDLCIICTAKHNLLLWYLGTVVVSAVKHYKHSLAASYTHSWRKGTNRPSIWLGGGEIIYWNTQFRRLKLNHLILKSNPHMHKSISLTRNSNLRATRKILFTRSQQCISMNILGRSASSLHSDDLKWCPMFPNIMNVIFAVISNVYYPA